MNHLIPLHDLISFLDRHAYSPSTPLDTREYYIAALDHLSVLPSCIEILDGCSAPDDLPDALASLQMENDRYRDTGLDPMEINDLRDEVGGLESEVDDLRSQLKTAELYIQKLENQRGAQ